MLHSGFFERALTDCGRYFDIDIRDLRAAQEAVQAGLTYGGFEELRRVLELGSGELATALGISGTTLARRRKEGRLNPEESERLLRLARLVEMARIVLSPDGIATWFDRVHPALGAKPVESARTEFAAQRLEVLLGRLADGGPA